MTYTVNAVNLSAVRLLENETVISVLQNSVPMYREFGLSQTFLDKPMPVAKVMMISALKEAIERWEPRAEFVGVTFAANASNPGELDPTVEVRIISE